MWTLRFEEIKIKNKDKIVFQWEDSGKPINIFHYYNESGKSTLYSIIDDIITFGRDKSTTKTDNLKKILTKDLLDERLEVLIKWSILNKNDSEVVLKIVSKKQYYDSTKQAVKITFQDLEYNFNDREKYITFLDETMGLFKNIKLHNQKKLSFRSLLRLNFINDDNYKSSVNDGFSECNIINHTYDSQSTPLYYYYIFNQFSTINELEHLYSLGQDLKNYKKIADDISSLINLNQEINQSNENDLFKELKPDIIYSDIQLLKVEINKLKWDISENEEIIQYIQSLILAISKKYKYSNDNKLVSWIEVLSRDLELTMVNLSKLNNELNNIILHKKNKETEFKEACKNEFNTHKYYFEKTVEDKDLINLEGYTKLKMKYDRVTEKMASTSEIFENFLSNLDLNKNKLKYEEIIEELSEGLYNAKFIPKLGKIRLTSSSDSTNRIERFISLVSFLFLNKINHFSFLVIDSPFVGVNDERRIDILNKFVSKFESNSQLFLLLNKNGEDDGVSKIAQEFSSKIDYYTGIKREKLLKL
jgi:hypothetical protein